MPAQAIRSDVIGSLLRPAELKAARDQLDRGELSPAALKQVEDRAVDAAVRLQEEAGLDVVTDGELRRYAFFGHLIDALDGFDKFGGWSTTRRASGSSSSARWWSRSSAGAGACAPRSSPTYAPARASPPRSP
jgi:5-methyltetrahydropteroyltriglutamate--homocysteine methyltransferase